MLSAGIDVKIKKSHYIQFRLYYGQGFQNIFNDAYAQNGLKAYHSTLGSSIGYQFGFVRKKKE